MNQAKSGRNLKKSHELRMHDGGKLFSARAGSSTVWFKSFIADAARGYRYFVSE